MEKIQFKEPKLINYLILKFALDKASADEEPKRPFRSWYLMKIIDFLIFISGGYDGK